MARINDLLSQMKQQGASDLHLTSGSAPYMRIHGDMGQAELSQRERRNLPKPDLRNPD